PLNGGVGRGRPCYALRGGSDGQVRAPAAARRAGPVPAGRRVPRAGRRRVGVALPPGGGAVPADRRAAGPRRRGARGPALRVDGAVPLRGPRLAVARGPLVLPR